MSKEQRLLAYNVSKIGTTINNWIIAELLLCKGGNAKVKCKCIFCQRQIIAWLSNIVKRKNPRLCFCQKPEPLEPRLKENVFYILYIKWKNMKRDGGLGQGFGFVDLLELMKD